MINQEEKKGPLPVVPNKPEIKNPSEREQKEVNREQEKIEHGPMRENIERQEIPQIPPSTPEIKQPEPAVVPEISPNTPAPNNKPA